MQRQDTLTLFDASRSSCAWRVRIALQLKGLEVGRQVLFTAGPEANNREASYLQVNPHGLVPALSVEGGPVLTQSLAIVDWLDERWPSPPLLPADPMDRAHVRAIALTIASDTQPFGTTRVTDYLREHAALDEDQLNHWRRHWMITGLDSVEALIARHGRSGSFVVGSAPTLADICVVPQATNAERQDIDLGRWPHISAVVRHCRSLPAFADTAPDYLR